MANLEDIPAPIVLFDGECSLCNRTVQFILRYDSARKLHLTPNSSSTALRVLEKFEVHSQQTSTIYFFDGENLYRESDAVLAILGNLPAPFRWGRVFWWCPRVLRDFAYRIVARTRYMVFGRTDNCALLSPSERERVIL